MMPKIWNTHLKPYFFSLVCFRKKSRVERWLQENQGAIQICSIDLGLSEANSACNDIKAGAYLYLNGCKVVPARWQDKRIYFQPTAAMLDLGRFSNFDDYARAVSKGSRGNDNRSVMKAQRLGYRTRVIDQNAYQASIDRIRRSKLIRTGGVMLDAIRPRAAVVDSGEQVVRTPDCKIHWSMCWGAFKDDTLHAYALLTRCGNIIRTIQIMGHRDALRDGALKLLVFDIVRSLIESDAGVLNGIRYFMYGALEHGREGLWEWKLRLQFHPSLPDMSLVSIGILPADFNEAVYLDLNADVREAKVDARLHYMVWGCREGRRYK